MGEKLIRTKMVCPCCGQEREIAAMACDSCGARQVGPPLAPPDRVLPKLGPAMVALACAILVLLVFTAAWIFSNDSKVGRAILVTLIGDGTKLTRSLLAADPKLPSYRIFAYDAYRQAFYLSIALIPLSLVGIWLARRAGRLIAAAPLAFGGQRMARASLILCSFWLVVLSTVVAFNIPDALERGRAKRMAATRATMYQLHQEALHKFYNEYGSYPQDLADLSRVNAERKTPVDYWEQPFAYRPVGEIASNGRAVSFTNYQLVSAGADGKFGTTDDLRMTDGVIIEGPVDDNQPISGLINER
ncbi:MAG: hypothetical protein ACK496_04665 [Acidobacteriota bacterium]|jgi:hypothetical protein